MSGKIFRVYTKTFGGKIWMNLHRVFPGNFFGKNFNKTSLEKFPPNIIKHHLVQKIGMVNVKFFSLLIKDQKSLENYFLFLSTANLTRLFFFLHEMMCGRSPQKALGQAIERFV